MASSAPLAIPQFLAIALAALPAGFQGKLDTNTGPYAAPQTLLVDGVHYTQDAYAELGPTYRHEEHYNLTCTLCSFAGDNDEIARMNETYGLYKSIQVAVANNPTLNGTIRLAWCHQLNYSPSHTTSGQSIGVLDFEVECQARVDSLD